MRDANEVFLCGEFFYREEREERKGNVCLAANLYIPVYRVRKMRNAECGMRNAEFDSHA